LAIDHQAFIDILYQGEGTVGGTMSSGSADFSRCGVLS